MGRDLALVGEITWATRDARWAAAQVDPSKHTDWPMELPDDGRDALPVSAWLEALVARAGSGAVREDGDRTMIAAWLDDGDRVDIGRGVCAALRAAGAHGGRGMVHLVSPDGSLGYVLRIGPRSRVAAIGDRARMRLLEALPAPAPSAHRPRPHHLPRPVPRAQVRDALAELHRLVARTKRFDERKRAEARGHFAALVGDARAIEALVGWLDHEQDTIAHGAADVLLRLDDDAALAPLAARLIGRHRAAAVAATFKRAPSAAHVALAPVMDALMATPDVPVLPATPALVLEYLELSLRIEAGERVVGAAFDFARHRLPTAVWSERWSERLHALCAVRDPALTAPRLLVRAGDARAGDGYVRAIDALGLERVAAQLAHQRPPGVRAALERAAREPVRAAIAGALTSLAAKLPR